MENDDIILNRICQDLIVLRSKYKETEILDDLFWLYDKVDKLLAENKSLSAENSRMKEENYKMRIQAIEIRNRYRLLTYEHALNSGKSKEDAVEVVLSVLGGEIVDLKKE